MPAIDVTIWYLEMLDPAALRPRRCDVAGWEVRRAAADPAINREYYRRVGADWQWTDRLSWPEGRWQTYVAQPGLETWIGYLDDEPVGYFELLDGGAVGADEGGQSHFSPRTPKNRDRPHESAGGVEIAYFGLLPEFVGRGLGGALLSAAIERAWARGPARVWVHTCSLDHPQALANYQARGMRVYKTETQRQEIG
ncbi:MAG: GNAT family N-acetyltransferase [Pirellulales bacterium]